METEELNQVLQREKEAREYPSSMMDGFLNDFDDDLDDDDESNCRYCDVKNCPDRDAPYLPDALQTGGVDQDGVPDFNTFLDDYLPDFPLELTTLVTKVFSKHGKNGTFPPRAEVARKDPWLADQLLREMQKAEADGSLPDVVRNWFPGW
jgi:hypothetical protein